MSSTGFITQIVGPVVDARFQEGEIPSILNALEVKCGERTVVLEVLQHIGDNRVRCVAMEATEGLSRGLEVSDTG
ncbi:MAG: F0F1 ATP synthase subunit beta, partial [Spirochaetales bacterium]|nr:F0F1 ATP synthase subunit beta [Spirochaetales bacterium]